MTHKPHALMVITASSLILTLAVILFPGTRSQLAGAQVSCCDPPTYATFGAPNYNPSTPKLRPYAQVTVVIQSLLTEAERATIEEAFRAWTTRMQITVRT